MQLMQKVQASVRVNQIVKANGITQGVGKLDNRNSRVEIAII